MEKEKTFDKQIEDELQKDINMNDNTNILNKGISDLVPVKKTLENLSFTEKLIDAIDLCERFKEDVYQYEISIVEYNRSLDQIKKKQDGSIKVFNLEEPEKPKMPFEFFGKNIFEYIISVLRGISPLSELENTLNNLPYPYVQQILFYLEYCVRNKYEVEIASRCIIFLLKLYDIQFSNDKTLIRTLESFGRYMRASLQEIKDLLNSNTYAINCLERIYLNKKEASLEI